MTGKNTRLLLVDGNSIIFRAFYAIRTQLTNHDGLHTNAIYGFKLMLDSVLTTYDPSHVLVAFDAGKKTFRTEKYAAYKGQRDKTPSELTEQFGLVKELLQAYGITSYDLPNYEADDIIGTMAAQAEAAGYDVTVVTGDRDLTQLATDKVTVAVTKSGVTQMENYTPVYVQEKLGVTPRQIIDLKALQGDSSDNYPGVTGVGPKTAVKLIKQYESVEALYENLATMKKSKLKEHLEQDQANAFLAKDLARIRQDAPVAVTLADTQRQPVDIDQLVDLYQRLDFKRFLAEIHADQAGRADKKSQLAVNILTNVQDLTTVEYHDGDNLAFVIEVDGDNYHRAPLAGFAFKINDHYFASRDVTLLQEKPLRNLLESATIPVDVFDSKQTYVALNRLGITLRQVNFDLLLVSYLLNNADNSKDMGKLTQEHNYFELTSDEKLYGKGAKRALPADDAVFCGHLAQKTKAIHDLEQQLLTELQQNEQVPLYVDIERPLAIVLAQMEITGVRVDTDKLMEMQSKFGERLAEIQTAIYAEAGEEFNLNSPKQLGVILFEKLKLPVIKKTKRGYSTAVSVLEKLRGMAPIIDNILAYRQLSKLQSTYIEGLLKVVAPEDGKVHTRYTQTLTATGRLSSVDPNLQNIPVRLEEGRQIRQAFVPSQPGWEIFSSDYSQIELRVLAHVSGDHNMQQAFRDDFDIHTNTAMRIFGIDDPEQVTANQRRQAKAVNFGIVYGISDFGLAQNLGISRQQAKRFITTYLENFPGVERYMREIVEYAREKGYVETILHRRRYLPDIKSKNFNLRSFAERTALNTPIQGSAADIIKTAMIQMQDALQSRGLQARMLMQVHDELIFEAPQEEIPLLEKVVPEVMDSAVQLDIPLKVESKHGATWFAAK